MVVDGNCEWIGCFDRLGDGSINERCDAVLSAEYVDSYGGGWGEKPVGFFEGEFGERDSDDGIDIVVDDWSVQGVEIARGADWRAEDNTVGAKFGVYRVCS